MKHLITFISLFFAGILFAQNAANQSQLVEDYSQPNQLLPVAKNGKWGLVNNKGKYILDNRFDFIEYHPVAHLFSYHFKNKKGIISSEGKILSKPIYEDLFILDHNFISTKKDRKWNLQKEENNYTTHQYDSVRRVANDIFILFEKQKGKLYYIHEKTPRLTPVVSAKRIGKGLILVQKDNNQKQIFSSDNLNLLVDQIDTFYYARHKTIITSSAKGQTLLHIDSTEVQGKTKVSYKFLNKHYYWCTTTNGDHQLFDLSTGTYYQSPELTSVHQLSFPHLYYWKNQKLGLWNLKTGADIVPPVVETITPVSGGFLTSNLNQYGIYTASGKNIIPTEQDNILTYERLYVIDKNGNSGLYSLSGSEIIPPTFDRIAVFDNNIKCYQPNALTVIKFNTDGSIQSKKTYDEYMSLTIEKERLPSRRASDVKFEGSGGTKKTINGSMGGWFQPIIKKERGDSIVEVRGNWGLKDENDSVRIRPQFVDIHRSLQLLTKAYFAKPINRYNRQLQTNTKNIKTIEAAKGINVAYNAPFLLVNDTAHSIISRKKYLEAYLEDFLIGDFARAFDGELSLINNDCKPIRRKLNFFGDYRNNRLRICEGGQLKFTPTSEKESLMLTTMYYRRIGAILCSNTVDKAYVQVENGQWYILDPKGNQLNDTAFQYIEEFYHGTAIAKRNNGWGVVDTNMQIIVPFEYEEVKRIMHNDTSFFRVSEQVRAHYLYNRKDGYLQETSIRSLEHYSNGKWFAQRDGQKGWVLMDTAFNNLSDHYDHVKPFSNGMALTIKAGKRTLVNELGQQEIDYHKARKIIPLDGHRFGLEQKRGMTIVSDNGDTLIDAKDCRELLASTPDFLIYENRYREIEIFATNGEIELPKNHEILSFDLTAGVLLLSKNNYTRLFDLNTSKFLSKKMENVFAVSESTLLYRGKNGLFGYLDLKGDTLCQPKYKKLDPLKNGWAFAEEKKCKGLVDKNGNYLFEEPVFRILPIGNAYQFYASKGIGIIDKNAKVLIPAGYKSIVEYNGFYKAELYNRTVDLYDLNGHKLNDKPYQNIKAISPEILIVRVGDFDYLYTGFLNKSLAFNHIMPVSIDLYLLYESRLFGLYNAQGENIIPVRYHKLELSQSYFQVGFFNSFGYYSATGLPLGDPRPN